MRGRRSLVGLIGANIMSSLSAGTRALTGGGMCVHQAAETFRLFTGVPPMSSACIARSRQPLRNATPRRRRPPERAGNRTDRRVNLALDRRCAVRHAQSSRRKGSPDRFHAQGAVMWAAEQQEAAA